ncbi:MAG TPA: hypothetical protein PLV21_17395 [Cyclobacteriaceae bacterium]|nr:hypothetical protein [Cyclobacteriaceae bacterium]HRJ83664.1 hypothetical protein [Cyclobacteriaceae bacterium]
MKNQKILIHLLCSICSLQLAFAQQKEQTLSVAAGVSFLARQDLVYSPFVHADVSANSYQLKYQRSAKYFQFAEVGFTYNSSQIGKPNEMDMDGHSHMMMPHEFLNINLTYGFGKSIQPKAAYQAWLGGSLQSELQAGFYNFGLSSMFGYFINQSAQVWYRRAYTFNDKHTLAFHVAVPIISWMARPPYLAEDDEFIENIASHKSTKIIIAFIGDGELVTWNKLQRVNFTLDYTYPLSNRFLVGAAYRFDFIHTNIPRTLLSYQHQLNISTTFKF